MSTATGTTAAKRILIVAPAWVGDAVMAQALFMRLKQRDADCRIDVLAPPWISGVLKRMPEVAAVIEQALPHGEFGFGKRKRLGRALAQQHYQQAIVLPNSWKSALVPYFARIEQRTGYVGELRYGLLNDVRKLDQAALPMMVQRFVALAEPAGTALRQPIASPALSIDNAAQSEALRRLGLDRAMPIAAFCPGAEYGPAKRWPAAHFAALAKLLRQRGYAVWLFGSAKDAPIGEAIVAASNGACLNLCGKTTLAEAVDLLDLARVVVSNDSGLMHVAAALDKPMAALYGSSSAQFTPPLSARAAMVSLQLECSPCFKRECPLGHFNCMQQLSADMVLQRLLPYLA